LFDICFSYLNHYQNTSYLVCSFIDYAYTVPERWSIGLILQHIW